MSIAILQPAGERVLLMGNEAIARGALEAGLQLMAAYPGTPASEICEALIAAARQGAYHLEWSTNEKVAFELAAGASLVGARAMTAMKNAGLNVAMDTFMTLPYGGVKGGLVVVVADDPNAHYSSSEQDTRLAAVYAEIPCLEPADQQEAKDMTREAFRISEILELPVFIRSVSRISHASGDVKLGPIQEEKNSLSFNKHYKLPYRWNVYGAPGPLAKHRWLHQVLPKARELAENSPFNRLELVPGASTAVLAAGVGASYTREALDRLGLKDRVSFLQLGFFYPLPYSILDKLLPGVDTLLVVEEGDPVIENLVRSYAQGRFSSLNIYGKSHRPVFPPYGEINTSLVTKALSQLLKLEIPGDEREKTREKLRELVTPRSSALCAGCSHLGSYWALREALRKFPGNHIINGDIGCYEQGGYGLFASGIEPNELPGKKYPVNSPYEILDTIHVMGSGLGLAQGQIQAGYREGKVVAVAGDSTFIHALLPSLTNAVYNQADLTFLILDNRWTAMTGHQPNPATGTTALGEQREAFHMAGVVRVLGVKNVYVANAYQLAEASRLIERALAEKGTSVVILEGECQLQLLRREKKREGRTWVEESLCDGCRRCLRLGCPAIAFDAVRKKAAVDEKSCVNCSLCEQVCRQGAIKTGGKKA